MVGEGLPPSRDFLLDTGILIHYLRKNRRAADLLEYLQGAGEISVSAITYMEVLIGCRPHEEEATLLFFDRVSPVSVSQEVAYKAASLIKRYPTAFGKDNPRGFPDALIAATAWQHRSTLITLNTRHFTRVPIVELAIKTIDQGSHDWLTVLRV